MRAGTGGESRGNALWGRRTDSRASALWGKGGRGRFTIAALVVALAVPVVGMAASGKPDKATAIVPASLVAKATANPDGTFKVIVQGSRGQSSSAVSQQVQSEKGRVKRSFRSISGVSADMSGKDILKLAKHPGVLAITPDVPMQPAAYEDSLMWLDSTDLRSLQPGSGAAVPATPAIAIVDSGVDGSKVADFGSRIVASVNLSSLSGSPNDEEGHGTMVAGIAAGASASYPGAAGTAPIVSVKTADANGQSMTSDVVAAADWVLANAQRYNIRVANFSMGGSTQTSFRDDPLDRAVESLWFNGVVVVAAAGNHGTGSAVDMSYAPGNDPFVITVGALDQNGTADPLDDSVPYWSAFGFTMDGFSKPDVAAPGRYMIAPVPGGSTIPNTVPDRIVAPGYIWMSGTSFSAPVVSGAAAQILARHPDWSPGQVKGALMLTANYLGNVDPQAAGVGEIDAAVAASLDSPPSANENLDAFVQPDPATGQKVFDAASWATAVANDASWTSASWTSASWAKASWSTASWAKTSWNEASWSKSIDTAMTTLDSWNEATYKP